MVLNHIAAIFFFSGPLFYIGLLMAADPASIAEIPELFVRALRNFRRALGLPALQGVDLKATGTPHRRRKVVRLAGFALLVFGMFAAVV